MVPRPPPLPPTCPQVERRRRPRGLASKLLTAPIPSTAIGRHVGGAAGLLYRGWPLLLAMVAGGLLWLVWASRTPVIAPRHRPEALWFALAEARFAPPMVVEPSAAVVRGRFNDRTPAAVAVREAMHFTEDMVIHERLDRVGDFDVTVLWLRLPGRAGHWLVVAWMEGADLAVASFRFAGEETDLSPEEVLWGNRLLRQVLVDEHFRASELPSVHVRAPGGAPPPSFGPKPQG